jgi:multiple sugar transport system substrate-binding protein
MRGFDFISADTVPYTFMSMILQKGGQFVNSNNEYDFNTPQAIEALKTLADYITVNKLTTISGLLGGEELENMDRVFLCQSLMAPRGMGVVEVGKDDYGLRYGRDFEYVAMPFWGPQRRWAAETGWSMVVNANSPNQALAWEFIQFMMEPDNLLRTNIACGMMPPRRSVAQNPAFVRAVPYAKPIVDILEGAQHIGNYNSDVLKSFICEALIDMVVNRKSAQDAVVELNRKLQEH